jgi:hypothetical protein
MEMPKRSFTTISSPAMLAVATCGDVLSTEYDEFGFVGTNRQYFAKIQYLFRR